MYTHITDYALDIILDQPSKDKGTSVYGKPEGFWFAPDLEWVKLMSKKGDLDIRAAIQSPKSSARVINSVAEIRAPKYLEMYEWVLGYRKGGSPPMVTKETKLSQNGVPHNGNHFVYQFSLDGKLEEDIENPSLDKVFKLTAENEAEFLAKVNGTMKQDYLGLLEVGKQAKRLGRYYVMYMSKLWGGIVFDESLFAPELFDKSLFDEPWSTQANQSRLTWKHYLEVPSGCLWHPSIVLGLTPLKEIPKPRPLDPPTTRAGEAPPPTAVLAWAGSKKEADNQVELMGKWAGKVSVPGFDDQENLVFFHFNGPPAKGGRRGRTFRRKPKRSNKNGRRFTRKSKHDVRRDRHA
jgi:hypothetical protein